MVAEVTAMINWKSKRRRRVNAAIHEEDGNLCR
jgi:hypothetical protein